MKKNTIMMVVGGGAWIGAILFSMVFRICMTALYDTSIAERLEADMPVNQMYEMMEKCVNCVLMTVAVLGALLLAEGVRFRIADRKRKQEQEQEEQEQEEKGEEE